jgi:tetratricopeptide (TPR) repeat protein
MPVKNEKDLNDQLRGYWLKAMAAIERRNFGYAIELLQTLLRCEPEFLTGRQMLRRAEVTRTKPVKKSFFSVPTLSLAIRKAQREVKKNPDKALDLIEKILETNPYSLEANLLLKEAAIAAGYRELAIFALETVLENRPGQIKILRQLGRLYLQSDQHEKAVQVYSRILELAPLDFEAIKLGRDAAAQASIKKGGWTEAVSYRDLVRDHDLALGREQQDRMQLGADHLEEEIKAVFSHHQADPRNLEFVTRLGTLHDQKGDLENAITWYQYAFALTNKSDSGLWRQILNLKIRQLDRRIQAEERSLAERPVKDADFFVRTDQLARAKTERAQILIEETRSRIDHNPADLQLRYELGEHLTAAGRYREALPELQRARQNPNARLKAMNLLGRCYRELGMLDLAVRQLEEAASEMVLMDATKKEILYELGLAYEQMGSTTQSIEAMKKIYESDYGFRDVARRVEDSYREPGKGNTRHSQ